MAQGSPQAVDRYLEAERAAVLVVSKPKTLVQEEFGVAVETDFWLA